MSLRAVGIVRVSKVGKRDQEERFHSPETQIERIKAECERQGLDLVTTFPEMNVSGGADLNKRHGLRQAVEMIEAGRAEALVVGYFDRLFRSLKVQAEVIERVEQAGGRLLTVDVGKVANGTAAEWLNATMHGMLAEYARRQTGEKTAEAQRAAIANGIPPFPLPPGLVRVGDHLEVDEDAAEIVREGVRMRADGATIKEVREFFRARELDRSYHGTQVILRSRLLIGEIHFGEQRGTCPAVVDRAVWERAQAVSTPRGRKPKSDRLLARQGILLCEACRCRMVLGRTRGAYPTYHCPDTGDCTRRVTISAAVAERVIVAAVMPHLDGTVAVRRGDEKIRMAQRALNQAQGALDTAVRAFSGLEDEQAAVARLAELRALRDDARARVGEIEEAHGRGSDLLRFLDADWDTLALDDQRRCVKAVVRAAVVRPALKRDRPEARITIHEWDGVERITGRAPQIPDTLA